MSNNTRELYLAEYTNSIFEKMHKLPALYNSKGRRLLPSEQDPNLYQKPNFKP